MVPKSGKKDPRSGQKSQNGTHGAKLRPRVRCTCEKECLPNERVVDFGTKIVQKINEKSIQSEKAQIHFHIVKQIFFMILAPFWVPKDISVPSCSDLCFEHAKKETKSVLK